MSRGPSPASRALLSMLGILFIFIGIVLMILGFLAPTGKVQAGGLILIGPIPLILGGELSTIQLLIIILLPIIIFILMLLLMLRKTSMEEES
ncbi:MAG: DUF131 domain-containing protein [Thaumarchaeota archaeon]|nr:DUF131 domain-containing protein [Nitrososphaerota archaeon]